MKYTTGEKIVIAFCILYAFQSKTSVKAQVSEYQDDNGVEFVTDQNNGQNLPESGITVGESFTTGNKEFITEIPVEHCLCNCGESTLDPTDETTGLPSVENATDANDENVETTTFLYEASGEPSLTVTTEKEVQSSSASSGPSAPPITCIEAGDFPHPDDCHRFFTCTQVPETETYEVIEKSCPADKAFSVEFSNCMRDLSPCSVEDGSFKCTQAGSFVDPENETSQYYRCVPRLDSQGSDFHKYLIKCGTGKIFMSQLGKCFLDFNNPNNFPPMGYDFGMPDDEQIVKAELKQWKTLEKSKLKAEKMRLKYEKKLQKEIEKKANKEAKEKSKSEQKSKEEFV